MESLWPILVLWILAAIFGGRKKRPPAEPQPTAPRAEGDGLLGGFGSELNRALEQLKNAERVARERQAGTAPAPRLSTGSTVREARAKEYLAERKARSATTTAGTGKRGAVFTPQVRSERLVQRPVRPLDDDDADKTSEDLDHAVVSLEGRDYDDEAEKVIAERRKSAARRDASSETLSAAQTARRADRVEVAIGGRAEHAAWHAQSAPAASAAAPARRGPLARFADGSTRSAIILAEIFGRPRGEV